MWGANVKIRLRELNRDPIGRHPNLGQLRCPPHTDVWMNSMHRLFSKLWDLTRHKPTEAVRSVSALADAMSRKLDHLSRSPLLRSNVYREQVELRLHGLSAQLSQLVEARLVFQSTETWRSVYDQVLSSCQDKRYYSVALIRSDDYWRDAPGENTLDRNYELVASGFHIHRVFLIDEFFWPPTARTPSAQLFRWILTQYHRGIEVSLIRLAELAEEPSLVCDMGIYGHDAVGFQQTNFEGKTVQFELCFDENRIREAEQRWRQLLFYAKPLSEIMEIPPK